MTPGDVYIPSSTVRALAYEPVADESILVTSALNYSDCHLPSEIVEVCMFDNEIDRSSLNLVIIPPNFRK